MGKGAELNNTLMPDGIVTGSGDGEQAVYTNPEPRSR